MEGREGTTEQEKNGRQAGRRAGGEGEERPVRRVLVSFQACFITIILTIIVLCLLVNYLKNKPTITHGGAVER